MRWSKRFLLLVFVTLLVPQGAAAQFNNIAQNARSGALGGVLLLPEAGYSLSLGYRRDYLLPDLAHKNLQLHLPVGALGGATVLYEHNGNIDYHEQQVAAGYTMRVASWLHIGVAARYLHLGTSDAHYARQHWLAASAQLQAQVDQKLSFLLLAGSRQWDKERPYRMHLQARYRPMANLLTLMELESEECVRWRFGMEYCYDKDYFLRSGLSTRPLVLTFGAGVRLWNHGMVDLAVMSHNVLGITPQISLTLCF